MLLSGVLRYFSSRALETRFTLVFAVISLPVLIAISLGAFHFVKERSRYYEERNLSMAAGLLSLHMGSLRNVKALAAADDRQLGADLLRSRQISVVVRDASGADLAGTLPIAVPSEIVAQAASSGAVVDWRLFDSVLYRVLATDTRLGDGSTVQLVLMLNASTPSIVQNAYQNMLIAIAMAGGVLIVGFGIMFTQLGLEPLRRLTDKTRDITASRLGDRMGMEDAPAELRELSESLNDMLQRLQDSFRRLDEFSSDLAHELRTPIGNMLGQSEVALSRARSVEEYRAVLESNVEEFQRLSRMIQDMLFLAQADNSERALTLEDVSLKEQADKVLEYYEPLLEEKNIRVLRNGADGSIAVRANRLLVQRAIANLISNAVRHAPRNTDLDIYIGPYESGASGWTELRVSNAGSRIPLEDMPWIFQRFFRGDAAKAQIKEGQEGWGLGLAIVKAIMDMHGGQVKVQSEEGLTSFTLLFSRDRAA